MGPGWALAGDAGYTRDPISAHGISDALRDSELCARAISRALHHPEGEDDALDWYEVLRDSMSMRLFEESEALASHRRAVTSRFASIELVGVRVLD